MPFTTWAAIQTQMLDDLDGQNVTMRDITKGSHRIVYTTFAEWKERYAFVCQMAEIEAGTSGTTGFSPRTYAKRGITRP